MHGRAAQRAALGEQLREPDASEGSFRVLPHHIGEQSAGRAVHPDGVLLPVVVPDANVETQTAIAHPVVLIQCGERIAQCRLGDLHAGAVIAVPVGIVAPFLIERPLDRFTVLGHPGELRYILAFALWILGKRHVGSGRPIMAVLAQLRRGARSPHVLSQPVQPVLAEILQIGDVGLRHIERVGSRVEGNPRAFSRSQCAKLRNGGDRQVGIGVGARRIHVLQIVAVEIDPRPIGAPGIVGQAVRGGRDQPSLLVQFHAPAINCGRSDIREVLHPDVTHRS